MDNLTKKDFLREEKQPSVRKLTKIPEDSQSGSALSQDNNRKLILYSIAELPEKKYFKDFNVSWNPKTKYAYESCIEWSNNEIQPFLTLYGSVGVGKSHLALAAACEMIENQGIAVRYFSSAELIRKIQNNMKGNNTVNIIDQIKNAQALIIDDVGREYSTPFVEATIHEIIDFRYSKKLPTFITTNHSIRELEKIVGVPVVSRLKDSNIGRFIVMDGKDIREQ